jgi:signal-transduction protein with cAMP-binding, CBS, and nucleotidyltransferase domain
VSLIEAVLAVASKRLVTMQLTAPLVDAAKLLSETNTALVVVCDPEGRMSGVVTKSDVVKQISHCQGCSCTTMVAEVMTKEIIACQPGQSLYDVWLLMKDKRLKQIPICNPLFEPLGVLYANEALEVLLRDVEYEELLLRDYVMGVGYR